MNIRMRSGVGQVNGEMVRMSLSPMQVEVGSVYQTLTGNWKTVEAEYGKIEIDGEPIGPAVGISDIARAMASADGRPADYENYKSTAHRMFHDFRRSVRINGAPFGADRSTAYQEQK